MKLFRNLSIGLVEEVICRKLLTKNVKAVQVANDQQQLLDKQVTHTNLQTDFLNHSCSLNQIQSEKKTLETDNANMKQENDCLTVELKTISDYVNTLQIECTDYKSKYIIL